MDIHFTDLEQAINFWRQRRPSTGEERALSPEVNVLATLYALMIFNGTKSLPMEKVTQTAQELITVWRNESARGGIT